VRFRSVGNVAGELDRLMTDHGATQVVFRDPLFSADRQRVMELCAAIRALEAKHGRLLRWIAETRPDHLDPELLAEMARSGCMEINLGLETASKEVSRLNHRPFTAPSRIGEIVDQCRDLGINVFLFFLVGLPGDTEQSFLATVEAIKVINPHFFRGFRVVPYPGTRVAAWAGERGLLGVSEDRHLQLGRICWADTDTLDQDRLRHLEIMAFRELCAAKADWLLANPERASFPELQRDLLAHVANLEIEQRWDDVPRYLTPLIEHPEAAPGELHLRRGSALARLGREEEALADYRAQAVLTGETPTLLIRQLVSLTWLGRRAEAEEALERMLALASSPEEAEDMHRAAREQFEKYDRAQGHCPPSEPAL
jgi:hypothetical protein